MADPRSWADAEHQLNACRLELAHQSRVSAGLQMRAELAEAENAALRHDLDRSMARVVSMLNPEELTCEHGKLLKLECSQCDAGVGAVADRPNKRPPLAAELHVSLEEWRDAGGPTEAIVNAIMGLIEDALDDYHHDNAGCEP